MKRVELYQKVRHAVIIDGMSRRSAARYFGINRKTVDKMLVFPTPPEHGRIGVTYSRKLAGFTEIIDQILADDRSVHAKQRHTGLRLFERLRDEHGFTGGITIVRDYVAGAKLRSREVFIPLSHKPGHAQVDFGEADGIIDGKLTRFHYFCMDLPHSDAPFFKAYPAEVAEAFCEGHVAAFAFFGGIPRSILYDNTKLAVAQILGDGKRTRSRMFSTLQSHYLFEDKFGRPGKGNDPRSYLGQGRGAGRLCWRQTQGRAQGPWQMDPGNHQALGYRQGLRAASAPLGRRTHLRMAGPLPPPRQRLGAIHRKLYRLGHHRQHPHAHTQNRKILLCLNNFRIGLLEMLQSLESTWQY